MISMYAGPDIMKWKAAGKTVWDLWLEEQGQMNAMERILLEKNIGQRWPLDATQWPPPSPPASLIRANCFGVTGDD